MIGKLLSVCSPLYLTATKMAPITRPPISPTTALSGRERRKGTGGGSRYTPSTVPSKRAMSEAKGTDRCPERRKAVGEQNVRLGRRGPTERAVAKDCPATSPQNQNATKIGPNRDGFRPRRRTTSPIFPPRTHRAITYNIGSFVQLL